MTNEVSFPSRQGLSSLLWVSIFVIIVTAYGLYIYLLKLEQSTYLDLNDDKLEMEESGDPNESLKVTEEDPKVRRVSNFRKAILIATVGMLSLLVYLLLVMTNAPLWLSVLGMGIVFVLLLNGQLTDEIRRQRADRIMAIISLLLLMTMAMQLATYAQKQVSRDQIYQGKARIVGYDLSQYDSGDSSSSVTRTDLEVAWGGSWGCPANPDQQCDALVQGALCESDTDNNRRAEDIVEEEVEEKDNAEDGNWNYDDREEDNAEHVEEEIEEVEEEIQEVEEDAGAVENDDVGQQDSQEDGDDDLVKKNEELEAENEELEKENEELEDELNDYESYTESIEEEVDGITYYYEDDIFYETYWDDQDWSGIWGEYACSDLFEYDLEGQAYDSSSLPGEDGWPYINIFGNCETCEAFIVDYFSTEHFRSTQMYKSAAINYGIAAFLSSLLTFVLVLKYRRNPTGEREVELLPQNNGFSLT